MAKAAVTNAVEEYNDAVLEANSARSTLNTMNYADYVPLGNSELVGTVVVILNGMGIVNLGALRNYTNADGDQVATTNSNGVHDTSDSNFDATGNLVVPNRRDGENLVPDTQSTGVGAARTNVENHDIALRALKEFSADNRNSLLQPVIDEAVRRAQAESDYYAEQLQITLADNTNQNPVTVDNLSTPVDESAPYSIASRNRDLVSASNERAAAESDLRAKVAAREAATRNVIAQFQSPGAFYAQLVARRQALQFFADKAVADATTPTKTQTDAAEAAAKAVADAEAAQASYLELVDDPEDPVVGLIDTLLETDGDDGKAVVDAISQTYDKTVGNKDAIAGLTADTVDGAEKDGPVTANRKAIDALTADTEDGAEADGPVTANRKAIDALKSDTGAGTGIVAANSENIAANAASIVDNAGHIAVNASNIASNAGNIAANAGNIASNAGSIAVNASNIVDNRGLIRRNAATLVEHGAFIERNAGHVAQNSERIGANAAAIGMNTGLIADNRHLIGELSGELDMVRAGVAASIALSRMPSVDGGGVSFGAGTFAGEMAYAVGFQVERGFGTFDVGLTSSGGEIGAGVGVGLKVWH